ncbi:MAG: polyphenol oxidase family protein, partial [Candidatus Omnitrophica bacterium]|nr:polyphenol oxidase family protein [Candidatus Omnitrophota bacterium]
MFPLAHFSSPRVVAFFSDRAVDFRLSSEAALRQAQQAHLEEIGEVRWVNIISPRQVHGDVVKVIDDSSLLERQDIVADGVVTNRPEIVLTIRTADCFPIFFYDDRREVISLAHAGWRGAQQRIAVKAMEAMIR